jgi:uncharacterized protein
MSRKPDDAGNVRDRLRRALPAAIRARDTVAVAALRSALAAIDNVEAVDPDTVVTRPVDPGADAVGPGGGTEAVGAGGVGPEAVEPQADDASASGTGSHPGIAGSVAGVGAGEVARRPLLAWEIEDTVRAEVVERQIVARIYEDAGRLDQADRQRREAQLLNAYLDDPEPPAAV